MTVFYKTGGKLTLLSQYKKLGVSGQSESAGSRRSGPMEFMGIEDQFFTATFIPDGSGPLLWHWTQYHTVGSDSQPEAEMAAGPSNPADSVRMRVYVGPKDLALLSKEKPSLEELVQFGWMSIVAKPMLFVLQWLHRYIPNYGWAIVALHSGAYDGPLANPRVDVPFRAKNAGRGAPGEGDTGKVQKIFDERSTQAADERGSNGSLPAGRYQSGGKALPADAGAVADHCWGFYRMLSGAIELLATRRGFSGFTTSRPKDPYYILPIAMAISTFAMTKLTPDPSAGIDPAQQRMMMIMPVMMAVIFINLSSGLNLYYFTSNREVQAAIPTVVLE